MNFSILSGSLVKLVGKDLRLNVLHVLTCKKLTNQNNSRVLLPHFIHVQENENDRRACWQKDKLSGDLSACSVMCSPLDARFVLLFESVRLPGAEEFIQVRPFLFPLVLYMLLYEFGRSAQDKMFFNITI